MALYQHSFTSPGRPAGARCSRCKRPLTDRKSIELGMGPECRGRSGTSAANLCKRDEFSDEFDNTLPSSRHWS
jgi:hypothetical protein